MRNGIFASIMNRIFFYFSNQHNLLVKLFIFIFGAGLIVAVLPRDGKFRYEFTSGRQWLHEDYTAPFSFAIKKSKAEIEKERQLIQLNIKRYYEVNREIGFNKQRDLKEEFEAYLVKLNPYENGLEKDLSKEKLLIEENGERWLEIIYDRGLIHKNQLNESDENPLIVEVRDGVAEEKRVNSHFSHDEAMQFIAQRLYGKSYWEDEELRIFFERYLEPNIVYNDDLTRKSVYRAIQGISETRGMVSKGELIILKGETITPEKFQLLQSVKDAYEDQITSMNMHHGFMLFGEVVIVLMLFSMLFIFIILLRKDIFGDSIQLSFLVSLLVAEIVFASQLMRLNAISVYLLPYCILPIIIRAFFDTRLALFVHILALIMIGFIVPNPFEFFVIQLLGGITCIFSIVHLRKRSQLFITITLLLLAYLMSYSSLTLLRDGQLISIEPQMLGWLAASAALTLFSYPLIYLFEKVFGFTSDVSLLELSDTNNPLLKELALKAPGTFQHSLQVANLAETAVFKIGGNSLLTRTGALYHDISKMNMSRYFIENQHTGINPHDELGFDESARIIISHVKQGVLLARKNKLPDKVIDFIRTHHGTSKVQYFYKNFLKSYPNELVDEHAFEYPGPIPYSKETAVVMMADAVEATSRSLKKYDNESIDNLVESIINTQMSENQFINADITFKDITIIKKVFKKMLMNIYHVRVEYPQ